MCRVAIVPDVTFGLSGCLSVSERTPFEPVQRNMAKFLVEHNVGVVESPGRRRCDESGSRPTAAVHGEFLSAGFASQVAVHCQPVSKIGRAHV